MRYKVGRIQVILDSDVEKKLRQTVQRKGDMSLIINNALRKYLSDAYKKYPEEIDFCPECSEEMIKVSSNKKSSKWKCPKHGVFDRQG